MKPAGDIRIKASKAAAGMALSAQAIEIGNGTLGNGRSDPSGSAARSKAIETDERDLSATALEAGLNADPACRLDGRPSGARAQTRASRIAIHRAATKGMAPSAVQALSSDRLILLPFRPGPIIGSGAAKTIRRPRLGRLTSPAPSTNGPHSRAGQQDFWSSVSCVKQF